MWVSLGALVGVGVRVADSVIVGLVAPISEGVFEGDIVCVSFGGCVATASVGVDAGSVAVVSTVLVMDGVAVGGGVAVDESLRCPGDGGVLMMIVPPSGMRDRLSLFFMAPKSIRSMSLPVVS